MIEVKNNLDGRHGCPAAAVQVSATPGIPPTA